MDGRKEFDIGPLRRKSRQLVWPTGLGPSNDYKEIWKEQWAGALELLMDLGKLEDAGGSHLEPDDSHRGRNR